MELILGEGKKVLNSVEDVPSPPTPRPQGEGSNATAKLPFFVESLENRGANSSNSCQRL